MSKMLRVILALLTLGLLITSCSGGSEPQTATVGQPAPDFELQNPDGDSISLSDLDRPVLINFWYTGCPPCRKEMPYLQQIYDERQSSKLVVLAINVGESASTVNEFYQDNNLSLPVVLDTSGAVARRYNIQFFPTTFFIDKDGIIQEKVIGAFPSKAAIEKRLSKIMP